MATATKDATRWCQDGESCKAAALRLTLSAGSALQDLAEGGDPEAAVDRLEDIIFDLDRAQALTRRVLEQAATATECELVDEACGCPDCGERRMDVLVWNEAGDEVLCQACGWRYCPPTEAA